MTHRKRREYDKQNDAENHAPGKSDPGGAGRHYDWACKEETRQRKSQGVRPIDRVEEQSPDADEYDFEGTDQTETGIGIAAQSTDCPPTIGKNDCGQQPQAAAGEGQPSPRRTLWNEEPQNCCEQRQTERRFLCQQGEQTSNSCDGEPTPTTKKLSQ